MVRTRPNDVYFDDLKYDNFVKDMESHFSRIKIVNFDIIHHECHGDKLQNPRQYYETICNKEFEKYESHIQNKAVSSAIKSECDDKNIKITTEREKFQNIVEDSLLKNSSWYLVPTYAEYRVKAKWFDYSNVVGFVLKRKTNTEN